MASEPVQRIFIQSLPEHVSKDVLLRGWVYRLRVLGKTTFVILRDCSGMAQCVAASEAVRELSLKTEDVIEIRGRARLDDRAKSGCEVDILEVRVLNRAQQNLPFNLRRIWSRLDWRLCSSTARWRCGIRPWAISFASRRRCCGSFANI